VDQFYFEEGYLEASYFTVIREAAAAFTVTASQSAVVDKADTTGYYIPDYIVTDYFVNGGQLLEADAALSVTATQTLIVERITQAAATVSVTVTKSCIVTRIIDSAASFTAAFAPTLTATAFKNHTAVLDSVSTMSVDAQANRSANVLLEHIADLNAMAAKTVDVTINVSHTATQSTTATKTASPSINLSSSAAIVCTLDKLQLASAELTLRSSLTTSRYAGFGRPRNVKVVTTPTTVTDMLSTTYQKFGTYSLTYHNNGVNTVSQFEAVNNLDLPAPNESWVYEAWFYFESSYNNTANSLSLGLGTKEGSGNYFFFWEGKPDSTNSVQLRKTGYSTTTTGSRTLGRNSWQHLLLVYHNGIASSYINGNRNTSVNISAFTSASWLAQDPNITINLRQYSYVDAVSFHLGTNLGYDPTQTTITVPTTLRTNNVDSTQLLWNFEGNGLDTIAATLTGSATLTSSGSLTAQANANTKQASADLLASVIVSAQGDRPASATADLSTTSTLSVIIGSVKDSITLNAGVFTVTAQESRLRDAASSITSAFTPTLNAVATRDGDIALSTVFALTADANSFTDSDADIASAFAVSAAVDGITRLGASALSSQFNQATVIGKLQSVSVPITSAFTTVMNVAYFEGTSLIAPMAAVMTVTAVKTARITKTLSAVTSVIADAFVAEFADYTVITPITDRGLIHFNTATAVDEFGGTISPNTGYTSVTGKFGNGLGSASSSRTLTNGSTYANLYDQSVWTVDFWYKPNDLTTSSFVMPISGILALSNVAQSGTYQANGGDQNVMLGWQQNSLVSANQANGYFYFGYHWSDPNRSNITTYTYSSGVATTYKHVAMVYEYLGSNNVRTTFYIDGVQQGVTTKNYSAYNPTTSSLVITPTTFRVTDRDGLNSFTKSYSGQLDELRFLPFQAYTANFTPETQEYNPPTQIVDNYKVAYARLESRSTLSSSGISVVNIQAALFAGTFTQTAIISSIRSTSSNQSSAFTTFINAGKNVEIGSDLASQSTIAVNAVKATTTSADLNVVAAQSTANDRIRTTTAALATTATISITAVKRTGIVLGLNTAATQSATAFRIQQGQASISALYSQLTVAFQNATGTVLLETVTAMQITAEKNAVGVIALASQFTQSTDSADSKTVRVSSAIAAEFTQSVEGLRIQPAGADVSAQFTQTTNTDQSKITRVTAAFVTTVTTTATAARTRSTPTTLSAATAIVCNNIVLREANANLVDNFDLLASPQYIIRITATFSAFNSQLTVGEIINIDPALQLMIEPETRIRKIQQETRVLSIESETRVNIIED
jgi:hypothetical protein